MTRELYVQKVKNIMINKNHYGAYHYQNFNAYNSYGEMAPINSDIINNMPNARIVLSEDIYETLLAVQEQTISTNKELPFFLYGKDLGNNQIEFTEFILASDNIQNTVATFNQTMIDNLENKIKNNLNNRLVVCHGHSHPPIGSFHKNFSLGDFTSYIQMNENNSVFKNRKVELTACLITANGDMNFVFYDNIQENFYRFINVFVKDKNNNYTSVNCYGLNQRGQLNRR